MMIKAGSMVRADGSVPSISDPAIIALNAVNYDNVPMPMPEGASPPFAWTLQPSGAVFNPPVEVIYPNMSGLPPGSITYFLSYNHDTHAFEIVASGSVSTDGSTITTDPGSGLSVAGWGCNCPPYAVTGSCSFDCAVSPSLDASACQCQTEDIDSAISQLQTAADWMTSGSNTWNEPIAYASDHLINYLFTGSPRNYDFDSQPSSDMEIDAQFNAIFSNTVKQLEQRIIDRATADPGNLNLQFDPYQEHLDSMTLSATFNLQFGINQTNDASNNPNPSTADVSNIQFDRLSGDYSARIDFIIRDDYSFDGIGDDDPILSTMAQRLEACSAVYPFLIQISRSYNYEGNLSDEILLPESENSEYQPSLYQTPPLLQVNGQVATLSKQDAVQLSNISAVDQFGSGGPGTSPDFISDDFMRAHVVYPFSPSLHLFSDPFQITQSKTFMVNSLTATMLPPPSPVSLSIEISNALLTVDQTLQLSVIAELSDGSFLDVTPQTTWTTYRSSNQEIATVDRDGLVATHQEGTVFITVVNNGATAVRRLQVFKNTTVTSFEGFLRIEDTQLPEEVTIQLSGTAYREIYDTSLIEDHFTLTEITLPAEVGLITLIARIAKNGKIYSGRVTNIAPMDGGITDIGVLTLQPEPISKGWTRKRYDAGATSYYPYASKANSGQLVLSWHAAEFIHDAVLTEDLDGDGILDIIVSGNQTLTTLSGQGNLLWSTKTFSSWASYIGDVDDDNEPEIFMGFRDSSNNLKIEIYNADGSLNKIINRGRSGNDSSIVALGHFGDYIVVGYSAGFSRSPRGVGVLRYSLELEDSYYATGGGGLWGSFALGNRDGDKLPDIAMPWGTPHNGASANGTGDGDLYGALIELDTDSDPAALTPVFVRRVDSWDATTSRNGRLSAMMPDLNNDGVSEILYMQGHDPTHYRGTHRVYHVSPEGTLTNKWLGSRNGGVVIGTMLRDMNEDGIRELAFSTSSGDERVSVVDGSSLETLTEMIGIGRLLGAGDLTGDGRDELLVHQTSSDRIRLLDPGSLLDFSSYPVGDMSISDSSAVNRCAISDITGDGILEVIVSTSLGLYVLTLQ